MPVPPRNTLPVTAYTTEYVASLANRGYGLQTPPAEILVGDIDADFIHLVVKNTSVDKNMVLSSTYTSHNGGGTAENWAALAQAFVQDGCVDPDAGMIEWYALPSYGGNAELPEATIWVWDGVTAGGITFPADPPPPALPSAGLPGARGFIAGNEDKVEGLRNIYILAPGQAFCHGWNVPVATEIFFWSTFFFVPVGELA